MVPGSIIRIPLVTLNSDSEFVDCLNSPMGQLMIDAEFYGESIQAVRLGVGRYRYHIQVPFGFPDGTSMYLYKSATVEGFNLKKFDHIGVIDSDPDYARLRHLVTMNEGLKTISLDSGMPYTADLQ